MSTTNHYRSVRETFRSAYARWSTEDDDRLASQFKQGVSIDDLATMFGRQPSAIESRLAKIGLIESKFPTPAAKKCERATPVDYDRRVATLILVYCEAHRRVYGEPYHAGQRLLVELQRGEPRNTKLLSAFVGVQQFLKSKGVPVKLDSIVLEGYIQYVLEQWHQLMIPQVPARLKNPVLLHKYLSRPMPAPEGAPVDYEKSLPRECFDDIETMAWLGLAPLTTKVAK